MLGAQDDKLFGVAVRVEGRVEHVDGFTCIAEGSQLVGVPGRAGHSLSIS